MSKPTLEEILFLKMNEIGKEVGLDKIQEGECIPRDIATKFVEKYFKWLKEFFKEAY